MDPAGSREWVDGVTALMMGRSMVGRFHSGSGETRVVTDNASEEVPETIGCSEILVVMVAGGEIRDEGDGSNDRSGVGGISSWLS